MDSRRVTIGSNGRFVIPSEFRKALEVREGDELLVRLAAGELRISTTDTAIKHAQARVRRYVSEDTSLADELIRGRREASDQEG